MDSKREERREDKDRRQSSSLDKRRENSVPVCAVRMEEQYSLYLECQSRGCSNTSIVQP